MKRTITKLLILMVVLSMVLTGCGSSNDADSSEGGDKASDTVTVYSPHPAKMLNTYIKDFKDKTGITVEIVAAGGGELLKRVEAESENPLGDVIWGVGVESVDAYKEYFEPYLTTEAEYIYDGYIEKDHLYTGDVIAPMIIMYNKDLVAENEKPETWSDLLDPKWKGQIAYADPMKSGSSYTQLATMLTVFGKEDGGWDFIEKFVKNLDGKILSGSSDVYKRVADGEYPVGITLENTAMDYVAAGANVGIIYPTEGTSARSTAVAIIKGCKNMENAKKFLDYTVSKGALEIVANEFHRRPARKDVELPEGMPKFEEINVIDYDIQWAANNKTEILEKWKQIVTEMD